MLKAPQDPRLSPASLPNENVHPRSSWQGACLNRVLPAHWMRQSIHGFFDESVAMSPDIALYPDDSTWRDWQNNVSLHIALISRIVSPALQFFPLDKMKTKRLSSTLPKPLLQLFRTRRPLSVSYGPAFMPDPAVSHKSYTAKSYNMYTQLPVTTNTRPHLPAIYSRSTAPSTFGNQIPMSTYTQLPAFVLH